MKQAMFWKSLKDKTVQCQLCPHFCTIKKEEKGKCNARKNENGKLISLVYGKPCSLAIDPIEKKPLYHFHSGEKAFSLATIGCNLFCKHCQNWQISKGDIEKIPHNLVSPEQIISIVKQSKCKIIAFTYTEPTIFYEYMLDIAKLAKQQSIKTVMITNGFINPDPLKKLFPYIDAFNIDIKSINEEFYKNICGATLKPVLETIKQVYKSKKHLELTNLIIPGYNDQESDIENLVSWVIKNLDKNIPLHFSAFYPCHQLKDISSTNPKKVLNALKIAKKLGMKNVYTGNI